MVASNEQVAMREVSFCNFNPAKSSVHFWPLPHLSLNNPDPAPHLKYHGSGVLVIPFLGPVAYTVALPSHLIKSDLLN